MDALVRSNIVDSTANSCAPPTSAPGLGPHLRRDWAPCTPCLRPRSVHVHRCAGCGLAHAADLTSAQERVPRRVGLVARRLRVQHAHRLPRYVQRRARACVRPYSHLECAHRGRFGGTCCNISQHGADSSACGAASVALPCATTADVCLTAWCRCCRCGQSEPSPGADVAGASPVLLQMWQG